MNIDETATAQHEPSPDATGDATDAAVDEQGQGQDAATTEDAFAVFGGEELKVEARPKDAHRGEILGVTAGESTQKHTPGVFVHLQSQDTGNTDDAKIWVPRTFAENVEAFLTKAMGIEDLPPGEPDPERPGKFKGNERAGYGMAIKNSAGDATIQQLLSVAAKSGRSAAGEKTPKNFEEYAALLNKVLTGLEVVYTRRPQTSDENPRGFLQVDRFFFPGDVIGENAKHAKALKNYKRQWEVEQG